MARPPRLEQVWRFRASDLAEERGLAEASTNMKELTLVAMQQGDDHRSAVA
jgi:hypothetical protein